MKQLANAPVQTHVLPAVKKKYEKAAEAEGLSLAAYVRRLLTLHAKELR